MNSQFVNYAFTTTIYSEKRNFLDTFSPFILKALFDLDSYVMEDQVSDFLKNNYNLTIPINTIKSILNGLAHKKLVDLEPKVNGNLRACISKKGKEEVVKLGEDEGTVARRQNLLIHAIKKYMERYRIEKSDTEIEKLTLNYVETNLSKLAIFETDRTNEQQIDQNGLTEFDFHLTRFLAMIEHQEPHLYSSYEELIKGAIIREHIANKSDSTELHGIGSLQLYLDANFIISLFGFHHESINKSAMQLFELLANDKNVQLKVFSMTLEEIARLLVSYKYNKDNYNPSIPVNSVFYYLKYNKFDDIKIDDLVNNLDHKVINMGIYIEKLEIKEIDKFNKEELELYRDVYSYKLQQNSFKPIETQKEEESIHLSALHDANIILAIAKKRGGWVKSLERSKAIFLTSSFLMDNFCKQRYRKEDKFPEVILDLTLTNIMWLINPNKNIGIHLHKLISVHSKRFLIDNGIWSRFVKQLKALYSDGEIDKTQYGCLFSNNQMTMDYLQNTNIEDVSEESILQLSQKIEKAIKEKDLIINDNEAELEKAKNDILAKEKELDLMNQAKMELELRMQESEQKQSNTEAEIDKLKRDKECNDYVENRLENEFYPLSKKLWRFLIGVILASFLMYFAEVADSFDYNKLGIPLEFQKWFKFVGFLYPFIFTIINYNSVVPAFRYKFDHAHLKREYEKKFKSEFYSQHL